MGNIEEMQKLQAKSKQVLIPAKAEDGPQAKLEIFPLCLDDMGLINTKEGASMEEIMKSTKRLIATSLKINEDQVVMNIKFLEELMKVIMEVNGFDTTDMKDSGIKKFIEEKKKAINGSTEQA
jgi:hypothetical protein